MSNSNENCPYAQDTRTDRRARVHWPHRLVTTLFVYSENIYWSLLLTLTSRITKQNNHKHSLAHTVSVSFAWALAHVHTRARALGRLQAVSRLFFLKTAITVIHSHFKRIMFRLHFTLTFPSHSGEKRITILNYKLQARRCAGRKCGNWNCRLSSKQITHVCTL